MSAQLVLIDTSAWVEFLRDTGSPQCEAVDRLLAGGAATTEPVQMEVLAGARDEHHLRALRGLLGRTEMLTCAAADFDRASSLYRSCRRDGETVRKLMDCLIAAVAMRTGACVLHADEDYEVLGRRCGLATSTS